MRVFLLIFVVALASRALGAEDSGLEDLDIESMLKDDNQRKAAYDCLMDKAPCGDMQKLRDTIPSLVETNCAQCSPKQKEKFDQVSKLMFTKYPKEFQDLLQKYSSKSE